MSRLGLPKPCPICMRGDERGSTLRFMTLSDPGGPFWYACDLCGYHSSIQDTVELAAHAWNTESREGSLRKGNNPVVEDVLRNDDTLSQM